MGDGAGSAVTTAPTPVRSKSILNKMSRANAERERQRQQCGYIPPLPLIIQTVKASHALWEANMAETPKLELLDLEPIILKLEGPFFGIRVHTKDTQYPNIDLVVQRRFLSSLKDEIIEMLEDFPEQAED
jgi:hypothetical protein